MGVTQYIGARYVPLFADPVEWNDTRTYEPLTIVLHEGNSYTSRQYVPKGIDIDNDDFWALTGNYNAQVEQYRKDVERYATQINEVSAKLNAEVTNRTEADANLQASIDAESKARNDADVALQDKINNDVEVKLDELKEQLTSKKSIDVYQIANVGGKTFTSTIVVTDKVGLIDCGTGMADSVVSFMTENGYDKFDYIVFTHMHGDHVDKTAANLAKLKPYVGVDTPIYIQMAPNSTFSEYDDYSAGYNAVVTLGNPTVPVDNATVKFGDTSVTFYNTNTDNVEEYSNDDKADLNIFSLVCRIDFNNSSFVDCGDIYWTAQNKYANIGCCDMFKWPHHGVDTWDAYAFIAQFAAKAYTRSPSTSGSISAQGVPKYYINRWYREITNQNNWYPTLNGNSHFRIIDGAVSAITNVYNSKPLQVTNLFGALNVDANTTDDIDAYKSWSLSVLLRNMTKLYSGSCFEINDLLHEYSDCQFAMQLYALLLGMRNVPSNSTFNVMVTKTVHDESSYFVFNFETYMPFSMGIPMNIESKLGKLPTYESLDDVRSKHLPENSATSNAKTLVGQLYDIKKSIDYLPRIVINGNSPTGLVFGSYLFGAQTYAEFVTFSYGDTGFSRFVPKPVTVRFNEAVGDFDANTTYTFTCYSGYNNSTATVIIYEHVYQFMFNKTHAELFRDSVKLYDSANDPTNKIIFISRM